MQTEDAYLKVLHTATRVQKAGDGIALVSADGRQRAVFRR
jgi:hypothetical protein